MQTCACQKMHHLFSKILPYVSWANTGKNLNNLLLFGDTFKMDDDYFKSQLKVIFLLCKIMHYETPTCVNMHSH